MTVNQWLISAQSLHESIDDRTVIFDCRFSLTDHGLGKSLYRQGHLPGARHLDLETDLSGPKGLHGGRHPLPDATAFTARMQESGVGGDSLVVAYDNNRMAGAARLWWLLRYFGFENVRVLDGGYAAWLATGYPVTTDIPEPSQGDFVAAPGHLDIVDQQWIREHLDKPGIQLIDSREPARFQGLEEPIDPIAGHIPGALNLPWQEVTNDEGFARDRETHRQRLELLPKCRERVVYCGSGVTACVNLLSFALAGDTSAKLYPGSWSDWCSYQENPSTP